MRPGRAGDRGAGEIGSAAVYVFAGAVRRGRAGASPPMTPQGASGPTAASRQEAAAPTPRQVVPDGCNIGVVLRVALGANAAVALGTLASHSEWRQAWARFLDLSAVVEPALLMTLLGWCALRRFLPGLPLSWQRLMAWLAPAAAVAMTIW